MKLLKEYIQFPGVKLDDDFKEAVKASTNKTQLKEYILDKMKEESV